MKIVRKLADLPPLQRFAISIGNFDGVHQGHRLLIETLCQSAREHQSPSVAVTFDPHPLEILRPGTKLPKLTTFERKAELLGQCGVDFLCILKTDPSLLSLSYQDFFQEYLLNRLKMVAMVEGPNFNFGSNREGTVIQLKELCQRNSVELTIVEMGQCHHGTISSSLVRTLIESGQIEEANQLLIDAYRLSGQVAAGHGRGKELGFPTANLTQIQTIVPANGVYGGRASSGDFDVPCAISIGSNPTFGETHQKIEVHLIDCELDVYGKHLSVEVLFKLREMMKFSSATALTQQIERDVAIVRHRINQ